MSIFEPRLGTAYYPLIFFFNPLVNPLSSSFLRLGLYLPSLKASFPFLAARVHCPLTGFSFFSPFLAVFCILAVCLSSAFSHPLERSFFFLQFFFTSSLMRGPETMTDPGFFSPFSSSLGGTPRRSGLGERFGSFFPP